MKEGMEKEAMLDMTECKPLNGCKITQLNIGRIEEGWSASPGIGYDMTQATTHHFMFNKRHAYREL